VTRVLIVSDSPLFGSGVEKLLRNESKLEVVRGVACADKALEQVRAVSPDVVVVDSSAEDRDFSSLILNILDEKPRTKIIALHLDDEVISIYHGEQRVVRETRDLLQAIEEIVPATPAVVAEETRQ
jgi:DNA-binding NarL/FixJ family response regulator